MTTDPEIAQGDAARELYTALDVRYFAEIWGEGFMSPGGPGEVARIVGGHDLAGQRVLDVGCGVGGAMWSLARDHGVARVVGADVVAGLLRTATRRAAEDGLADRLEFVLVTPNAPLPFADGAFDAVFSKDSILHVADKSGLFAEIRRVLRPGGRLLYGDWFRGHGRDLDEAVEAFNQEAGGDFTMTSLQDTTTLLEAAGFVDLETDDRTDWYHVEAGVELARYRALAPGAPASEREYVTNFISFWETLVDATGAGVLRPGHVRARRP